MAVSHRERFQRALSHEETDRVPLDLGGGPVSQMHPVAYNALLHHLNLEPIEEAPTDQNQRLWQDVVPDERVLRRFDIDIRGIWTGQPDGRPDVALDPLRYRDEWGVTYRKAHTLGEYMTEVCPLQHLDSPSPTDLGLIDWPDPNDPGRVRGLRERALQLHRETDFALVLNLESATLALAQRLRGFTELLEDLLIHQLFVEALFERVTEISCRVAEAALAEVGDLVDAVTTADDLGFQTQPYMSPDLYRALVKPYHRRLVEAVRSRTEAKFVLHSDGSIDALLPDLIDIGVEVINPVQVSATGMEPETLKRRFGRSLGFWGGIDTQHLLPNGTPADVAAATRRTIESLGAGGGYVLATVHNVQADVPAENLVAMFTTATEVVQA